MDETTFYLESKSDPMDRVQIEVGDSKQTVFYPQVKMMRWDNEANFSVRLQTSEFLSIPTNDVNNKINCNGSKLNLGFYPVEDGYEFDIVLLEKPSTNIFTFSLETKNLVAYYQPTLNAIFKSGDAGCQTFTETEGIDKDGKRIMYRPPNIVGSYALYHSSRPDNINTGKAYRTGKFGHIYRPQLIDAAGATTWAELSLDLQTKKLTVTIPRKFLNDAVYPVEKAAGLTIGNTNAQATQQLSSSLIGFFAGATGTVSDIRFYCGGASISLNTNCGIYNGTSGDTTTNVGHGTSTSKTYTVAAQWITIASLSIAVSSGTNYWLVPQIDNDLYFYFDSGGGSDSMAIETGGLTYDNWGSNPSWWDGNYYTGYITSVYATYTAGGGPTGPAEGDPGTDTYRRRVQHLRRH